MPTDGTSYPAHHFAVVRSDDIAMGNPWLRLRDLRYGSAVALLVLAWAMLVPSGPAVAQLLPLVSRLAGPFAGHQHQPDEPLNDQGPFGDGAEARHFPLLLPLQSTMVDFDGPGRVAATTQGDFDQHGATAGPPAKADADVPNDGEISRNISEVVIGSCAGGAFLGSFSAVTAVGAAAAPVAATAAVAPIAVSAIVIAAGSGCAMGITAAIVSLSAIEGWNLLGGLISYVIGRSSASQ